MAIPTGVKGRILNPKVHEVYILVQNDLYNTGGYLILQSDTPDFATGYDNWVLENELEAFFIESGWEIEWFIDSSFALESNAKGE